MLLLPFAGLNFKAMKQSRCCFFPFVVSLVYHQSNPAQLRWSLITAHYCCTPCATPGTFGMHLEGRGQGWCKWMLNGRGRKLCKCLLKVSTLFFPAAAGHVHRHHRPLPHHVSRFFPIPWWPAVFLLLPKEFTFVAQNRVHCPPDARHSVSHHNSSACLFAQKRH